MNSRRSTRSRSASGRSASRPDLRAPWGPLTQVRHYPEPVGAFRIHLTCPGEELEMKRSLFLAALALALVAACGVGAGNSPNAGPASGAKSGSAPSAGRSTASPGQAVAQDQGTAQGPRGIQTASISLEVRSFDAALDSVIAISA